MSRLRAEARRLRLSLDLLVGRRAGLVVAADLVLLLFAFILVAVGEATSSSFYSHLVVVPLLALGVPVLADAVALERRAGSLDLALTSPGAAFYFERRVGSFAAVLAAQGMLAMTVDWLVFATLPYPLLLILVQIMVVTSLLAAAALFWAVRLQSAGSAIFAVYLTVALLGPWFFHNPVPEGDAPTGRLLYPPYETFLWARTNLVLALAAAVLYLYARRRLDRPESLLA